MKKRIALVLSLILLLMCALPALAEVRRGSRGEEVRELQQLLMDCGWLFEVPDGVFGRNTEAALMSYQNSVGLPVTGVADDATLSRLRYDRDALFGSTETEGDPPVCCVRVDEGAVVTSVDCGAHQELRAKAEALLEESDGEAACKLWTDELSALYDRWMQAAQPADRLNVIAARASFLAWADNQKAAMLALYKDDEQYAWWQYEALLHAQAGRVCQLLWALEGEGGEAQ